FGLVFNRCKITAEPEVKIFLGRPWRAFASSIFLNTEMSDCIKPEGWNNWGRKEREQTSRYSEFGSTGPGAASEKRVAWAKPLSQADAKAITKEKVLGDWKP